ncbi:MAG: class I SAM-dependent methyltransferase [Thermofilaceae archaeon]|nr:class I SAM-dependent methyltransferase [Thermofilaceae archaeon]
MSLDYSLLADIYDELYGEEQNVKYSLILAHVKPIEPVLDAGCGTGLLLELLSCYFVGLDLSQAMLKVAKNKGRGRQGDLVRGSVEYMPFRDEAFRTVYSITVVHEVPSSLKEIIRVVKPSGKAVVTILRKSTWLLPRILEQTRASEVVDDPQAKDIIVILDNIKRT